MLHLPHFPKASLPYHIQVPVGLLGQEDAVKRDLQLLALRPILLAALAISRGLPLLSGLILGKALHLLGRETGSDGVVLIVMAVDRVAAGILLRVKETALGVV